jgi:hypothetical protein
MRFAFYRIVFSLLLLATFVSSAKLTDVFGRIQSSGVKGVLMCDGRPAGIVKLPSINYLTNFIANVKVKLYDDDRGIYCIYIIE